MECTCRKKPVHSIVFVNAWVCLSESCARAHRTGSRPESGDTESCLGVQLLEPAAGQLVSLAQIADGAQALLVMWWCNHCPFVKHLKGAHSQDAPLPATSCMDATEKGHDRIHLLTKRAHSQYCSLSQCWPHTLARPCAMHARLTTVWH